MRLRGGLAVRRTIGVGVPDGCISAGRWSPLEVRITFLFMKKVVEGSGVPDRPAGDFRAARGSRLKRRSYRVGVEGLGVEGLGRRGLGRAGV